MSKVNYAKSLFGVRKWRFSRTGDFNLLCKISIFSSFSWPGLCRPCKKHLTWCLKILRLRWNYIEYIDFYSVLELIKNNRQFFNDSLGFNFWKKDYIRQLISRKWILWKRSLSRSTISFYRNLLAFDRFFFFIWTIFS